MMNSNSTGSSNVEMFGRTRSESASTGVRAEGGRGRGGFMRAALALTIAAGSLAVVVAGCRASENARGSSSTVSGAGNSAAATSGGKSARVDVAFNDDAKARAMVGFIQYPSISPDGSTIVFAWLGDLWAMPSKGGVATRLTAHAAEERRSAFSPDGKMIAFESDRDGGRNLFVMPISKDGETIIGGRAKRVTALDRAATLSGFTSDGKALLFNANLDATLYRSNRMYRVGIEGDEPQPITRLTDAFGFGARMSPDGKSVTFTRGRADFNRPKYDGSGSTDVYRMSLEGDKKFERLTSSPRTDGDAFPLADGSVIFVSSRDGTNNVYRLKAGASDERAEQLTKFAPKAEEITIGHGVRDLSVNAQGTLACFVVWDTLYTLDLTKSGAEPTAVTAIASPDAQDAETQRLNLARDVSEASLSPDGKTMAVIARGEVFVRSVDEGRPTRRVTFTAGRERGLSWSPDGRVLWFSSDETGPSQIYYATVSLAREDITPKDESKKDEEKKDEEKKDESTKKDEPKKDEPKKDEPKKDEPKKDEPAAGAAGGAAAVKADETKKPEEGKKDEKPAAPAKKKVDFGKRWAESIRFEVKHFDTSMIPAGRNDGMLGMEVRSPMPSPDGTKLLVTRGLGDLVLIDLKSRSARVLLESWNDAEVQWASDSRHIVYAVEDLDFNSDVFIMDTAADATGPLSKGVNVTRHPDLDGSPRLSADGKVLYFLSERGNENFTFDVYALILDKKVEALKGWELDDYFKKAAEAAGKRKPIDPVMWDEAASAEAKADAKPEAKPAEGEAKAEGKAEDGKKDDAKVASKKAKGAEPLKFDLSDPHLRVRKIVGGSGSKSSLAATPGGERVIFVGDEGADRALQSVSFKGDDKKVISPGSAGGVEVSLTGSRISFVKGGAASLAGPSGGKVDTVAIDAPVVLQVSKQQRQKFLEAARIMGNTFYHPTLKGLNWKGISERYLTLAQKTRTSGEFDRVFEQVLGELDGSHTGINSPGSFSAPSQSIGYLGIETVPVNGGFKVTKVIFQGPADKEGTRLNVGDVITSIDGRALAENEQSMPSIDLHAAMAGKAGKEALIEVNRAPAAEGATTLPKAMLVTPISASEDANLRYQDTVRERAMKVEQLSGGKLGYLHIRSMSQPSVDDFERDLFAAASGKLGLIIDVRDNGGGSTADILLSSLTAPNHAYTVPRGADPKTTPRDAYPRDRRLIYGYGKPINVLINENSFSNAEIFAHAIKTIKRGTLIGTATFGGVISTGAASLLDGASLRTPFRGWYLPSGADYENNGAKPDVNVAQTPQDEVTGKDAQLEAAVKELLGRVEK